MEKIADEITETEKNYWYFNWRKMFQSIGAKGDDSKQEWWSIYLLDLLEWCIVAPVEASGNDASVAYNRVVVQDLISKAIAPHYFSVETDVKDIGIEQMLHKMHSADFIDQSLSALKESDCEMSFEDRRFMEIINRECAREGEHYKLPLSLRDQDQYFPNN